MKKIITLLFLTTLMITGCQQEEKEAGYRPPLLSEENSSALIYFENKDYATDGKNIYINAYDGGSSWADNYQLAEGVDAISFEILKKDFSDESYFDDPYFKDKNHLYYNGRMTYELRNNIKILEGIDSKTAKAISTHCVKDSKFVYCDIPYHKKGQKVQMKKVEGADSESFSMIGENEIYFKDKVNVFCNQSSQGINIQKLEEAEPDSFILISGGFSKDKDSVFKACDSLDEADPESFKILENTTYQKDKNNVYFEGWKMEEADPESFVIFNLFLTKDKNAVYYSGKKVDEVKDPASFEITRNYDQGKDKFFEYSINEYEGMGLKVGKKPIE